MSVGQGKGAGSLSLEVDGRRLREEREWKRIRLHSALLEESVVNW